MSVEGLLGTDRVFAADLQDLRPQHGQARAAANVRGAPRGSPIVASHRGPEDTRVQDAYSLRCGPAVGGAARDTVEHAAAVATRELAPRSTTRSSARTAAWSPTATSTVRPLAYVLDFLAIAAADVASIAERRTDRFLDTSAATACRRSWPTIRAWTRA